jgi:uncharacterized membrane protein YtjA (UPF0391 family)
MDNALPQQRLQRVCRVPRATTAILRGGTSRGERAFSQLTFTLACAGTDARQRLEEMVMGNLLHYALVFLVVALVAAAVGFGGVAGFAMEAARLLFWVFIVLFVVSLVAGLVRRA